MTKSHRISRPAAARFTGVPLESLDAWAAAGIGPVADRQGHYDTAEFTLWTAEMRVAAHSIEGA